MEEPEIFARIREQRGDLASIHQVFENFIPGVEGHYTLYQKIMLDEELPLCRAAREMLAVYVSEANRCPYCVNHHQAALEQHDNSKLDEDKQQVLKKLAESISREPWKTGALKNLFLAAGYNSAHWQHAVMIASYFNMANRLAFAMSLELEPDYRRSCS
ncbi:MAG: carboxymuconolactone decarboxylase family protein [bacterium]